MSGHTAITIISWALLIGVAAAIIICDRRNKRRPS